MIAMHPLIRIALATCPSDYRREYRDSIARDLASRDENVLSVALDLFYQGAAMRFESLVRNLTFAVRTLWKAPLYTLVAALTIALAIAANAGVASVLASVLLKPLPYPNQSRIVLLDRERGEDNSFSYLDSNDVAARTKTLQAVGISTPERATMTGAGDAVVLSGADVNEQYFGVLGVHARLGRLFDRLDLGSHHVLISEKLWRSDFGAARDAIGHVIEFDGVPYTVVGVIPAMPDVTAQGLVDNAYWKPVNPRGSTEKQRGYSTFDAWGLLSQGTSVQAAQTDLNRVVGDLVREYQARDEQRWPGSTVQPMTDAIVSSVRPTLISLYAVVVLLLIIACANVANLVLVRMTSRARELSVRSALGATRGRVMGQLIAEMSLVSAIGGIAGIAVAWLGLRMFAAIGQQLLPRWNDVTLSVPVILYIAGALIVTTLVVSIAPAMTHDEDLSSPLKAAGRSGDRSAAKRLRSILVIAEIGLAVGVVLAAGLVVRSFATLTRVDLGLNPANLYELHVPGMPQSRYPNYASNVRAANQVLRRIRALPNVTSAAITTVVPLDGEFNTSVTIPGLQRAQSVDANITGPGYFTTMGIPILRGRDFTESDGMNAQAVIIVNADFARAYYGTLDVIGKRVRPGITSTVEKPWRTIVGVVGDARAGYSAAIKPQFLLSYRQIQTFSRYVIRTNGHDSGLEASLAKTYRSVDPMFALPPLHRYTDLLSSDAGRYEAAALLFSILAAIALVLALAGIYAVTSYSVEQRTQEFGIRKAIGAHSFDVVREVLGSVLSYSAVGLAIGLGIAAAATGFMSSVLFQTSPLDPLAFATSVLILVASSVVAALVPALRAVRVQPATALRYE